MDLDLNNLFDLFFYYDEIGNCESENILFVKVLRVLRLKN